MYTYYHYVVAVCGSLPLIICSWLQHIVRYHVSLLAHIPLAIILQLHTDRSHLSLITLLALWPLLPFDIDCVVPYWRLVELEEVLMCCVSSITWRDIIRLTVSTHKLDITGDNIRITAHTFG